MHERRRPTHGLAEVRAAIRDKRYMLTGEAEQGVYGLKFDREDVEDCFAALDVSDCYKSMPSNLRPGRWQDVYTTTYAGKAVYVKFDFDRQQNWLTILSFKKDESR